jgi:hypothetical protein
MVVSDLERAAQCGRSTSSIAVARHNGCLSKGTPLEIFSGCRAETRAGMRQFPGRREPLRNLMSPSRVRRLARARQPKHPDTAQVPPRQKLRAKERIGQLVRENYRVDRQMSPRLAALVKRIENGSLELSTEAKREAEEDWGR